jgi:Zn-dependent protease with chaperone function
MTFVRRCGFGFCFALLFTCLAPLPCPAQQVRPAAAPTPVTAPTAAAPAAPQQAYTLPADKLAKAIMLSHIRLTLEIVDTLWGLAVLWLLLSTRAAAWFEAWTKRVLSRRWLQGLLFFAAFFAISTLASLPLDVIGHVVSRHYNISVQGWGGWLGDQAKELGFTLVIGSFVLLLFNWIVRRWPRHYWLGLWTAMLPLMVLSIFVAPLVAPLFDKFEPLTKDHATLVTKLETVVARTGTNIAPDRMFLMKASAKTNGLNAYVSGIGSTKRIVVWDTTAGRIPDDEVLYIFGHESGHYVLRHIPKELTVMAAGLFFVFWGCAWLANWLGRRFDARWQLGGEENGTPLASRTGFLVLMFALSLAGLVMEPASNTLSRYFEHQADIYGQEAIHGIVADPQKTAVSAFNHLGEAWLEDPSPNAFVEFWTYNHPSVKNRANFALHYNPWANGGHGEFFSK